MRTVLLVATIVLALTGCGTTTPAPSSSTHQGTVISSPSNPGPKRAHHRHPLQHVHDPGQVTGTVTGPCHTRQGGQLPDRHCTPGAYDPALTAAQLCDPGYSTSTYRPPSSQTTKFKYQVYEPAAGMTNVTGELDHLIPLELGGANDAANLWVQPGSIPNPKDAVENHLADWVCAATGPEAEHRLHAARRAIARNWMTAEQHLGTGGI